MTPAGFIQQVESMQNEGARVNVHYDSSVTVEEIGGSLDGSAGACTSAAPVSYECRIARARRLVSHVGSDQSVSMEKE